MVDEHVTGNVGEARVLVRVTRFSETVAVCTDAMPGFVNDRRRHILYVPFHHFGGIVVHAPVAVAGEGVEPWFRYGDHSEDDTRQVGPAVVGDDFRGVQAEGDLFTVPFLV